MKVLIIVEGRADKDLLEKLLSDLPPSHARRVEAANGKDAARPIVRKHLLRGGEPTAFVFDTDTTDRSKIQDQLRAFWDYFRWGSPEVPFEMFPMIPSIEAIFFDRPQTLERRMKKPIDPSMQKAGELAPKQVLQDFLLPPLGVTSLEAFIHSLTPEEVEDLRQYETIVKLRRFVEEVYEPHHQVG